MYIVLIILLVIFSLGLIGVVLIQSGKGGGLSGAFGLGEGQAVFGSRAGDVLTKATEIFAIGFMVLCIAVTWQAKMADESIVVGNGSAVRGSGRTTPLMSVEEAEAQARLTNQVPAEAGISNILVAPLTEKEPTATIPEESKPTQ
jgi:preprotein translocase subunit SecG